MDRRAERMARLGVAEELAEALVEAGFDSPRKVKAAKVTDLRKVKSTADKDKTITRWRSREK